MARRKKSKEKHRQENRTVTAATDSGHSPEMPGDTPTAVAHSAWIPILQSAIPILILATVALAAYWNAWPNTFVFDDKYYQDSERFAEFSNIPRYFTEDAWASSGVVSGFYRPLFLSSITLDAYFHGDWAAGYHLTNIFLHALTVLAVWALLQQLLQRTGGDRRINALCALLAALLFAVHPVHTEVVNSIFNRSEMLVALGSATGLAWLLRFLDTKPLAAWMGLGLAYLAILFCKESAAVLPGLAIVIVAMTTPGNWIARARKILPAFSLLLPLAVYFALRYHALSADDAPVIDGLAAMLSTPYGANASADPHSTVWFRRLLQFSGLVFESIKVLAWPHPLSTAYGAIPRFGEYLGLILSLASISFAIVLARRSRWGLAIGLAFFYIALLPISRLEPTPEFSAVMRERFLYLPSIGIFAIIAFSLRYARSRLDSLMLVSFTALFLIMLTPLTWARNDSWRSDVALFESDYANGAPDPHLLKWLSAAHNRESNFERVAELCDRHGDVRSRAPQFSNNCAIAYGRLGRFAEQEAAYLEATRGGPVRAMAHANLGRLYLSQDRWDEARDHFQRAVEAEKSPASQAYRMGHMLVRLYPDDPERLLEAKAWFERSLELQPDYLPARQWLAQIDQALQDP